MGGLVLGGRDYIYIYTYTYIYIHICVCIYNYLHLDPIPVYIDIHTHTHVKNLTHSHWSIKLLTRVRHRAFLEVQAPAQHTKCCAGNDSWYGSKVQMTQPYYITPGLKNTVFENARNRPEANYGTNGAGSASLLGEGTCRSLLASNGWAMGLLGEWHILHILKNTVSSYSYPIQCHTVPAFLMILGTYMYLLNPTNPLLDGHT